jgi:hypothetical protein
MALGSEEAPNFNKADNNYEIGEIPTDKLERTIDNTRIYGLGEVDRYRFSYIY